MNLSQNFSTHSCDGSDGSDDLDDFDALDEIDFYSQFQDLDVDLYVDVECQTQLKTITAEEYKTLMNLIPKVEKLKCAVERMEKAIKTKNAQLKELRDEEKKWKKLNNLSTVSILWHTLLIIIRTVENICLNFYITFFSF